jgi:hypothetical protein
VISLKKKIEGEKGGNNPLTYSETAILSGGAIVGNSENEKRHIMKFSSASYAEPKSSSASAQFHGIKLVILNRWVSLRSVLSKSNKKY